MNRMLENFDVQGDSLYNAWKGLYEEWQDIKKAIELENYSSQCSLTESADPILNSILTYPTVQRKAKPARKKLELPKHMTCEEALKILKLKDDEKRNADIAKEARRQKLVSKKKGSEDSRKRNTCPTTEKVNLKRKKK